MTRMMKDSGVEWIGEIPCSWELRRLKDFFDFEKGKNAAIYTQEYIAENVGDYPVYSGQTENNGIMGKINQYDYDVDTCLFTTTVGAKVMTSKILKGKFSLSQNCLIMKQKKECSINFYYYALMPLFEYTKSLIPSYMQPSLRIEDLKKFAFYAPDLQEQQKIAAFLDDKCGEIDKIITQTEQSIEEYKKLKQSVITKAVTKGIRPNRPMQDSNIEWIGEIPQDWEIKKIKYLFRLRDERNTSPLSEVNLISLYTDLGVIQHCDIEATTGNKAQTADGYKKVYNDDIVVNIILCWMGAIGRSAYDGVTSPAYDVYKPINNTNSRFYHYYFRTKGFNGECYQVGRGIMLMRWRTYSEQFKAIKVVVPPLDEQKEIADYLDEKCAEIDTLIEKKQQFLAEMANYKKSLIYEYVTGKKEVA